MFIDTSSLILRENVIKLFTSQIRKDNSYEIIFILASSKAGIYQEKVSSYLDSNLSSDAIVSRPGEVCLEYVSVDSQRSVDVLNASVLVQF